MLMDDVQFWVIVISNICVDMLLLAVTILFSAAITALLWYYQRRMHNELTKAIADLQLSLTKKETYRPLLKALVPVMLQTVAGIMTSSGKHFGKIIREKVGNGELAAGVEMAFDAAGDLLGKTAGSRVKIKAMGRLVGAALKASKKSVPAPIKEVNARPAEVVVLSDDQKKALQEAQDKILTDEQKKALADVKTV